MPVFLIMYRNKKTKAIKCIDCGEWFEVDIKDNKSCRCETCQHEYRKAWDRERKKKEEIKIPLILNKKIVHFAWTMIFKK